MLDLNDFFVTLPKSIAVAVSGGPDSFALLHLTQKWAVPKGIRVVALTVDHQLRKESTKEAEIVAQWCKENNIEHRTLVWQGEKPQSGIQAKARNERRRLLCAQCKMMDIGFLLMGHQADDQAETMLMRLQRGTGLKGLKAMQIIVRDKATKVAILRPLLNFRRNGLLAYCIANNLPHIEDPSNDNPVFERVRIRQALAALPKLAIGVAKSAERLRRADDTLQQLGRLWADENIVTGEEDKTWLPATWRDLLPELQLRVLERLCPQLSLSQLEKLALALQAEEFPGVTFGSIWISPKIHEKQAGFLFRPAPERQTAQA